MLCDAVASQSYLVVSALAKAADLNVACPNGELPLYRAIIRGDFLIVEALTEAGADVNAKDMEGNPLLYHAIALPRGLNVVDSLIEADVDVNARDIEGNPLLYHAIVHPRGLNVVDSLIGAGVDASAKDGQGNPLLYHAIQEGGYNIVQSLIRGGADVNARDAEGKSLLRNSSREGRPQYHTGPGQRWGPRPVKATRKRLPFIEGTSQCLQGDISGHDDILKILVDAGVKP